MSKGYLVLAQGSYIKHAVALAKSINETQSTIKNISIIVDNLKSIKKVDRVYFDKIITLDSLDDLSLDKKWKIHNRAYFYDLTPYDETVILDADMLFLTDVSHWWNYFNRYNILPTASVLTYRNEIVKENPYRKTFVSNNLPNVYSAFTYFKKSKEAETVFALVKSIISNWNEWINKYAPIDKQSFESLDLALAIALKILDVKLGVLDYPTFVHMKSGCQGWNEYDEDWKRHLGIYRSEQGLRLGDYLQSGILHYVDKGFLELI